MIRSLRLIQADNISYNYKEVDRNHLENLYDQRGSADDILIVKNDLITDTYYGNVALLRGEKWYTPSTPLLKGTMRHYLLEKEKIIPKDIYKAEIKDYSSACVFNAMIPFGRIVIPIDELN